MAEFPSKVSTQTTTPEASGSSSSRFLSVDASFLRSIQGILMIVEMCLGLLVWALIADSNYQRDPPYQYVMFVALFCWLLTVIFFVLFLLRLQMKLTFIPWHLTIFVYHVVALLLYITGFFTCAASVDPTSLKGGHRYNKRAAASFFACLVMIAYGAGTFFSFRDWRGASGTSAAGQA